MKVLFSILLLILISISSYSQTNILFDATKAETANNADWIIDADSWNLIYNPNPGIGGNEANPSRYPTPSQSGITASTSENYWTGAISAWAVDAVQLGYNVETLPYNGSITYGSSSNSQDLSNYDIFVVCEPNILFTSSEKTAIMNFVQDGGSLFMIADHDNSDRNGDGYDSPYIWNDLMNNNSVQNNPFGITFDYEYFTEATYNIPNLPNDFLLHGDYGNVTKVEFYGGTSMTLNSSQNPSVIGVVYREGYSNTGNYGALCAYSTFGNGKIVALGDSSPADDGTGDNNDNLYDGWIEDANGNHERLIMNATIWLATPPPSSNISVNNIKIETSQINQTYNITVNDNSISSYNIDFFDISGRLIIKKNNLPTKQKQSFNITNRGIYFYQIRTSSGEIINGKISI